MTGVIIAAAIVGGTGIIIGLFLGISGEKLKVEVDEKEVAVREALPGNNCGGCGYPGCDGLAKAIAKGEAPANGCPVCSAEAKAKIAEIHSCDSSKNRTLRKRRLCSVIPYFFVYCDAESERRNIQNSLDYLAEERYNPNAPGGRRICRNPWEHFHTTT